MKRIAYFIDTYPRPTENFILRELAGMRRHWSELRVYCFHHKPENLDLADCRDALREIPTDSISSTLHNTILNHTHSILRHPQRYAAILLASLRMHRYRLPTALRRFDQALRLARLARRDSITHLHAHFATHPATVCHLAARLLPITYSVSAHAHDVWASTPLAPVIENATCIIACTAAARDHLQNAFPNARVHLVRHGLPQKIAHENNQDEPTPPPTTLTPPPPPLRIISAGRFVSKKGLDTLIDACAILSREGVEFHCDIYGEGPLRPQLESQILKHDLTNEIHLHPFAPHDYLLERISSAHLFILPCRIDPLTSDRDGIPNVLLEAIDQGTIVIASDLPTIRELIENKANGFLSPPDNPTALAGTIHKTLQNQTTWPKIRQQAHRALERRFDLDANLKDFKKIIEESYTSKTT